MNNNNNIYNILNNFNKIAHEAKPVNEQTASPKSKTRLHENMEQVSEKYMGFKKVAAAAKASGAENPEAVAASIGRKKYGKEQFQKAAAAGKKLGETSQTYRDAEAKQRSAGIQGRADDAEARMHQRAAQPKTIGQKVKQDIVNPLKKLAKGDVKGALGEAEKMEEMLEGIFGGGVDHDSVAGNLAKLARVIKSVQTPEQFAVAQKYAKRMSGTIMNHQHDKMGFGSGLRANLQVMRAIQSDLKAKAQELGISYDPLAEGFPTVADARKQSAKEKGTGKFDKKSISTGTVYSRKYDAKSGESEETGKDAEGKDKEKRGRGRPKKSTFEGHSAIDKLISESLAELIEGRIEGGVWVDKPGNVPVPQGLDRVPPVTKPVTPPRTTIAPADAAKFMQSSDPNIFNKLTGQKPADKPVNAVTDPEGVKEEESEFKQSPFANTGGGAATGNPNMAKQALGGLMAAPAPDFSKTFAKMRAKAGLDEADMEEGNEFSGALDAARDAGEKEFTVGGKTYQVKESDENFELNQMRRIAGLPVVEAKKANKDYDGDGKVESGKDEYLGSKIRAAKKAGKLEEGEMCKKCDCDPCECDKEKVDECMTPMGGMAMDAESQEGKMNINTSMDSDGHKSVSITADGNSALELMQMLKLAGMGGSDMPEEEPEGVMVIAHGEEEVEEDKDERYHANTTPEEKVMPVQVQTKGGNGDVAGQEKHMTKSGYKFGDNNLAMKEDRRLMKEYESIKIQK